MPRARAFTLVELLVVVAIIAVVISLLIPAVHSIHGAGRTVKCLANLRSLQVASMAYATDHRGALIDVGLPHGGASFEEIAWVNTLQEYYSTALILRSPLDRSPHWSLKDGGAGTPLDGTTDKFRRTSYGCNNYLSRTFSPIVATDASRVADRLSRIPSPALTVHFLLMAEIGQYAGSDHVHAESWWVNAALKNLPLTKAASQVNTNAAGGPPKSWDARANYGFVDGSAMTLPFAGVYLNNKVNRFDPAAAPAWATAFSSNPQQK
jgi:prepilin-type N-terminal cleavage/methylation domain-containing protein/prepilin-type processing-associated H-X9-DG protein